MRACKKCQKKYTVVPQDDPQHYICSLCGSMRIEFKTPVPKVCGICSVTKSKCQMCGGDL